MVRVRTRPYACGVVRTGLVIIAAAAMLSSALPSPAAAARPDGDRTLEPGLQCTQELPLPTIANVIDASWSPDSRALAVTWFARLPSKRTVTGHVEDEITDVFDVRTGTLRPLGVGDHPEWSASGRYTSYWGPRGDELRVVRDERVVARLTPTVPEVRWAGNTLLYIEKDAIRRWSADGDRAIGRFDEDLVPHYPGDDVHWSGDGERFTLTHYSLDGTVERYLGLTATGEAAPLDLAGATYTEWAPAGATLLVRYGDRLELRDMDGSVRSIALPTPDSVHSWGPDGRALLLGRVSPTVPAGDALDGFRVWGAPGPSATATLPNLMGVRRFSPDGTLFTGVSRTGPHDTRFELYRCTAARSAVASADAASRRESIDAGPGRLIRPAAGDISQFLQGSHTGIDVAAPLGSLVVASDDGVVDQVGWVPVGGQRVCVQHAAGLESCYYHTSASLVVVGDRVARGQPVALIGMTGFTTGPHVHWEAKVFGRIVDPLQR